MFFTAQPVPPSELRSRLEGGKGQFLSVCPDPGRKTRVPFTGATPVPFSEATGQVQDLDRTKPWRAIAQSKEN